MNDFERLCAYLDNELADTERAEFAARMNNEPQLKAQFLALQAQHVAVQAAFLNQDEEPLPVDLLNRIAAHRPAQEELAKVLPLPKKRPVYSGWAWASAASIALALGLWWFSQSNSALPEALLAALNNQPAGAVIELNPQLRVEILATYQNKEQVCRALIEHRPEASRQATACWHKGQWHLEQSARVESGYQTASGDTALPPAFSAAQERTWLESRKKH